MVLKLLKQLRHPDELGALYKMKVQHQEYKVEKRPLGVLASEMSDLEFCYAVLTRVSRSFAVVIQQLPQELRDAVCLYYLILRGLDTIEDDTNVPRDLRIVMLENFHEYHYDPEWKISGIGDSEDYRALLENYPKVTSAFRCLDDKYQRVIIDSCKEMAKGMVEYLDQEVKTVAEYDEYCYYVAGLVGIGLSKLFAASGLQSADIIGQENLSNSMGLFLQKTNIIRDFHEDILAGRTFWPAEIWKEYTPSLSNFIDSEEKEARYCLNHLITDALRHLGDCLAYLRQIEDQKVFQFCAIPQVMAIATLAEIYDNAKVFRKNVKIRKGLAAKLILQSTDYKEVESIFQQMASTLFSKINLEDPNAHITVAHLHQVVRQGSEFSFGTEKNPLIKVYQKSIA